MTPYYSDDHVTTLHMRAFERPNRITAIQVTVENMAEIAQHFGLVLDYSTRSSGPLLWDQMGSNRARIDVGEWVNDLGHKITPPDVQGYIEIERANTDEETSR